MSSCRASPCLGGPELTRRRERAEAPTGTRRAAREFAFRVLFEAERGQGSTEEALARAGASMRHGEDVYPQLNEEAFDFARDLLLGFEAHRAEIDALLARTIRGWSFEQMAQTDLNVLRLSAYEMTHSDSPLPPIIESAVRIARKFGGEDSGRFVNGVLGGLARDVERREGSGDSLPPA